MARNLIVSALAGSGKTTTMIWGVAGVPARVTLSPEQEAIHAWMRSVDNKTTRFVAFNKSIATELQQRIPSSCEACTCHSSGLTIIRTNIRGYTKIDAWKFDKVLFDVYGDKEVKKEKATYNTVSKIIDLARNNMIGHRVEDALQLSLEEVEYLRDYYDLNSDASNSLILEKANKALQVASENRAIIDFTDMVWMPSFYGMKAKKVDLLIVDECQDLNRAQQELILKQGHHIICIGDHHQAIYGFSGADNQSMFRLQEMLGANGGVDVLPLNTTRRCGSKIVAEANKIVPELKAAESNGEGVIENTTAIKMMSDIRKGYENQESMMVVCRTNAPIVSLVFRLIKDNIRANIQGRDIGQGLITTINKFKEETTVGILDKLEAYEVKEEQKIAKMRWGAEEKLVNLQDRCACIRVLCNGLNTREEVEQRINDLFKDQKDKGAVLLSSVHRSKGLEANTVYIYRPDLLPHPKLLEKSMGEQEYNLQYVAITRAIKRLVYVKSEI